MHIDKLLRFQKCFLLLLFWSTQVSAQETLDRALDSVVIRENRLTYHFRDNNRDLQILTKEQIATLPVKSTTELLAYVNGIDLRQRGPSGVQADIGIDGSSFDQVLILVNGMKMSDPQTGHHVLNLALPVQSIERIEVLRGAAAKIYGVNALAGVINIITRTPDQHGISGQVYGGSSFEKDTSNGAVFRNFGAQATAALAYKDHSHLLSISHDQGNGYRYNTAYEMYRVFYNGRVHVNDNNHLEVTAGYLSSDFGAGLFYAAPSDHEAKEKVQTVIAGVRQSIQVTPRLRLTPGVSYRYNKDDYIYIRQKPEVYRNIHETHAITGELHGNLQWKKGTAGLGVEWRKEKITSNGLGKHDRDNIGVYAEYKHWFSGRLNAGAGVYANYNSEFGTQLFPGIDVGYHAGKSWKIYASASSGQRLPTYTDLYYTGPGNIGNSNLRPESAHFAEMGVNYQRPFLNMQGGISYRETKGFIDWVKKELSDPWQPQNFQAVSTAATFLRAAWQPGKHLDMPRWLDLRVHAGYTYLEVSLAAPDDKISKYAIDALRHQLTGGVSATFFRTVQLHVNTRYQYRISANDYTLLDARVAWMFSGWSIYADINNMLGTAYKEAGAVPLPGRWFTFGVRAGLYP